MLDATGHDTTLQEAVSTALATEVTTEPPLDIETHGVLSPQIGHGAMKQSLYGSTDALGFGPNGTCTEMRA